MPAYKQTIFRLVATNTCYLLVAGLKIDFMTKDFIIDVYLESKLTKKDFAKKLSISTTTLNNWLSGKSEPLFVNQKIIRQVFKEEISKIT